MGDEDLGNEFQLLVHLGLDEPTQARYSSPSGYLMRERLCNGFLGGDPRDG